MRLATIGLFWTASLGLTIPNALAAPTYLTCSLDGLPPNGFSFTVNEDSGTIGILIRTSGNSRVVQATYTPDKILVDEREVRWMISRTDLRFSRTIKLISSTTWGSCMVDAVPSRAF